LSFSEWIVDMDRTISMLRVLASLALASAHPGCVEAVKYYPPDPHVPTVPKLRLPQNNAHVGSVVLHRLQPQFVWEPSSVEMGEISHYVLQYSSDLHFERDVVSTEVTATSYQPSVPLDVSTTPPVGRRYYWRVRACAGEYCSESSPTWWINVGRSDKDYNGDGYDDVLRGDGV
jgi:hypothetical protein